MSDAGPDPEIVECCECLLTVDVAGEPCASDLDVCVSDLEMGALPGPDRCGVGGRPYCSDECGIVWPGYAKDAAVVVWQAPSKRRASVGGRAGEKPKV